MRQPLLKLYSLFFWEHDKENVTRELEHHKRGLWTERKSIDFSHFFHSPFSLLTLIPLCVFGEAVEKERAREKTWERLCPSSSERKSLRDCRPQYMSRPAPVAYYVMQAPIFLSMAAVPSESHSLMCRHLHSLISFHAVNTSDQPELSFHMFIYALLH